MSHGGLQTGCLAEDGVTETRGDSPQTVSAGWDGHANVSLGRAAFVQRADIAQRVGDDSAAIVVRPVVGSDELDCDIEARVTGGVVGVEAETGMIQLLHARLRRIVELVSAAIAAQGSCGELD